MSSTQCRGASSGVSLSLERAEGLFVDTTPADPKHCTQSRSDRVFAFKNVLVPWRGTKPTCFCTEGHAKERAEVQNTLTGCTIPKHSNESAIQQGTLAANMVGPV